MATHVFPVIALDLEMDRKEAVRAAGQLARTHGWGPTSFSQAASFGVDREVQTFVELGGGGTTAFEEMLERGDYEAYTWQVRHFAQGQVTQTFVEFTPAGEFYSFSEELSEESPGPALEAPQAREIAEAQAGSDWSLDLGSYQLVESTREEVKSGRVDHVFSYERTDRSIGDGKLRLDLVLSGDRLTAIEPYVKVPQQFERRFEELRSFNDGIAFGSSVVVGVLYFIGGCGLGLLYLLRRRKILWKQPVIVGGVMALGLAAAQVSAIPLSWTNYDTASSKTSFLLEQLVGVAAIFIGSWVLLAIGLMAAEGLTRLAFPDHIQLWRLWSKNVAPTEGVLGRTLSGYLYTPIALAFIVLFYYFVTRWFGWYIPASTSVEPNVLAQWFPWVTPVAVSAQAGFLEECLFRAVPIAGAAIIGQRFGKRKLFVTIAFFLQAVIFAAAHANYPGEPPYSRVVELIVPSLVFGAFYIRFGLLPGVILHYVFDLSLFSIPLFTASDEGLLFDRAMVLVWGIAPLGVVLFRRIQSRAWGEVPLSALNLEWNPPAPRMRGAPDAPQTEARRLPRWVGVVAVAGGVAGLALWGTGGFDTDAPRLEVSRKTAETLAIEHLQDRNVGSDLRVLSSVLGSPNEEHEFVWQRTSPPAYRRLLGSFLDPPLWSVRLARFDGPQDLRAEEWEVLLEPDGKVREVVHLLPEERRGAHLSEGVAGSLARVELTSRFGGAAANAEATLSDPSELPNRTDWTFEFIEPDISLKAGGEARYVVEVSGDEVTDSYRYVFIPEREQRRQRAQDSFNRVSAISGGIILGLAALAAIVASIVLWSRQRFDRRLFFTVLIVISALEVIDIANEWPAIRANFVTEQPYVLQAVIGIVALLIGVVFASLAVALLGGMIGAWKGSQAKTSLSKALMIGGGLGSLAAGAAALGSGIDNPYWPDFGGAGTRLPLLSGVGSGFEFLASSISALLFFGAIEAITGRWKRRRVLASGLLIVLSISTAALSQPSQVGTLLGAGVGTALGSLLLYVLVLRSNLILIVPASGVFFVLQHLAHSATAPFPGARVSGILAAVLVGVLALWFTRRWVT